MKRHLPALAALVATLGLLALPGCVAPVGPVEVTRFHLPDTAQLGHGTIAVEPAIGQDGASLEFHSFAAAVARELTRVGYGEQVAGRGDQVALLSVERELIHPAPSGSPVSVGLGGTTGSHGSSVGVGIGVNLSGQPADEMVTRMSVAIRDRASGRTLWEGRASFSARASAPVSQTQLGAAKMAQALFRDFPGKSGETILVE